MRLGDTEMGERCRHETLDRPGSLSKTPWQRLCLRRQLSCCCAMAGRAGCCPTEWPGQRLAWAGLLGAGMRGRLNAATVGRGWCQTTDPSRWCWWGPTVAGGFLLSARAIAKVLQSR
jgi:hypothetical protein